MGIINTRDDKKYILEIELFTCLSTSCILGNNVKKMTLTQIFDKILLVFSPSA